MNAHLAMERDGKALLDARSAKAWDGFSFVAVDVSEDTTTAKENWPDPGVFLRGIKIGLTPILPQSRPFRPSYSQESRFTFY